MSVCDLAVPPKLSGVSFDPRRGEVLGFAGLLGSGRTELLGAIGGVDTVRAGTVLLDQKNITSASYGERVKSGIGMSLKVARRMASCRCSALTRTPSPPTSREWR